MPSMKNAKRSGFRKKARLPLHGQNKTRGAIEFDINILF